MTITMSIVTSGVSISIFVGNMTITMPSISQMSIAIVRVSISLSSRLGISGPLAVVVSKSMSIISQANTISVVTMTITMSSISMHTMAISIMAVVSSSGISISFSLASSSGEHTEGNNSNGFHHYICLQARGR